MVIKVIAMGFVWQNNLYFQDGWNYQHSRRMMADDRNPDQRQGGAWDGLSQ
jgi:hypothetical protein